MVSAVVESLLVTSDVVVPASVVSTGAAVAVSMVVASVDDVSSANITF